MNYPEHIDMHMHSIVSDGTDSPLALIHLVKEKGIGLFSLTDHDGVKGCGLIMEKLKNDPPADFVPPLFIPGVEFSCRDDLGKYHILGYNYDPDSDPIRRLVEKGHGLRMEKLYARLDFLREEFGFRFSDTDLTDLVSLSNPGKPHIANLMIKYGYARDKEDAIRNYINKKKVQNRYIKPAEAITSIIDGGGIPVLAHPSYGDGSQIIVGKNLEERIKRLKGFGIKGLEAYYSGFTPALQNELLRLSEQFDLYVTAGSDYHGKNKLVQLGDTNMVSTADAHPNLRRFLDIVLN